VVETKAFPEFSIANWAEVDWISIGLFQMVGSHHEALIEDAVTVTKHMSDLVGSNFAYSHQNLALFIFFSVIFFISEIRHKSS